MNVSPLKTGGGASVWFWDNRKTHLFSVDIILYLSGILLSTAYLLTTKCINLCLFKQPLYSLMRNLL